MSLRSFTQADKELPSHLGGEVTLYFLHLAILSPSGLFAFFCLFHEQKQVEIGCTN